MLLKQNNSKFINKLTLSVIFTAIMTLGFSQEIIKDEERKADVLRVKDTSGRIKADGVAAVVGDFIVLDSDVDRRTAQIKAAGGDLGNITRCELFGSILEEKLYAHQAIQDSIVVNELQIRSQIDQQIQGILGEFGGSMDRMLEFYKKDSEDALREEIYEINKNQSLASQMRDKVIKEVEITPEEVRQFYNDLKEDGLPTFGTELQISNIVVIPEVTEASKQKAIDRLKGFKKDVEENGASFTTKVLFFTEDTGSKSTGGLYTLNRKRPRMVKEFRDVAFSLQEGEISEPFESPYGYHIILLEKIRGQEYDVRHILIRPEITPDAIEEAQKKIEDVRAKILDGSISFADAAREFSDEKETKFEGGQMINPVTQDFNFELTKMDPDIYGQVQALKDGEVSEIIQDGDRENPIKFKIMMVTNRINEHEADFSRDYLKIKRLALQDKHFDAIGKWQKETIESTYIKINGEYRDCEFSGNWLKNK
ncbi:periplasmic chaperone for outer membrane proteins SurA [Winogradskyella jejuensis]|uniref:Periplasmic chaperone for outer membrane proteins SurA n=2 Tax=Winogradskyella jejuensis TaxID=1089305 RepID=A0A1M5JIT6_9FLAO|nr:periplasmic chaperone for outer membrane proteins SurA [Winogradskyella jejuensis]